MTGNKGVIFGLIAEERFACHDVVAVLRAFNAPDDLIDGHRLYVGGVQCRADRHKGRSIFRKDGVLFIQTKRLSESAAQPFQKVERAAQKEHLALDAPPLREAGDRLVHHRLKDTGGDILLARPLIEEGLDI